MKDIKKKHWNSRQKDRMETSYEEYQQQKNDVPKGTKDKV
jgi:hypothetical protein